MLRAVALWGAAGAAASSVKTPFLGTGTNPKVTMEGANPVIEMDLYRAMAGAAVGKNREENDDLADLYGALKYVHTEAITEHALSPPTRTTRKNNIDVISKFRFKIKNTAQLLGTQHSQAVDFGPFQAYDNGEATQGKEAWDAIANFGDFTGVQPYQQPGDARWPMDAPYFWFSISGRCPNLEWNAKGSKEDPSDQCYEYTDQMGEEWAGKKILGGLCDDGVDTPTGQPGCTYTYEEHTVDKVSLDDLVGIKDMDCGGKNCVSWLDWRRGCTDEQYQRFFKDGKLVDHVGYCVEYDIHPACENDCNSDACLAVKGPREVGLPFWQGRCDQQANRVRAEKLAAMFGIEGAGVKHTMVAQSVMDKFKPCHLGRMGGNCGPSSESGGPYCSRLWSGVCATCYIPGTTLFYPANETQPACPITILKGSDYGKYSDVAPPTCKSRRPRDLCCLYMGSCEGGTDLDKVKLDEDGLAVAASKQSTKEMIHFLSRLADSMGEGKYVKDDAKVQELAYWLWDIGMPKQYNVSSLKPKLKGLFTTTAPPADISTGATVGIIIAAVVGILVLCGVVGVLFTRCRRTREGAPLTLSSGRAVQLQEE